MNAAFLPVLPDSGTGWQGVSPRLATLRRTEVIVIAALVVAAGGTSLALVAGPWAVFALVVVVAAAVGWLWWLLGRNQRSWHYAERAEDLLITHGVMFRTLVVVPYGRMQFVDIKAGPLERFLGIAAVQLHTASAASDAHIPGLLPGEAGRLRDRLASLGEAHASGL